MGPRAYRWLWPPHSANHRANYYNFHNYTYYNIHYYHHRASYHRNNKASWMVWQ